MDNVKRAEQNISIAEQRLSEQTEELKSNIEARFLASSEK